MIHKFPCPIMKRKYPYSMTEFQNMLKSYKSPKNEESIAKNIPMHFLDFYYKFARLNGRYRIKYRGPSNPTYDRPQSYCLMNQATSFAIYHR